MISIRNLRKSFEGSVIFDNVNIEVEKGETLVIIGGSGCGKSTLLRCINRLEDPDSGEILINGVDIAKSDADLDTIRRSMGMVYQQFNLFSHLNVLENVILAPVKVLGMEQEEAIKEAEKQLKRVGMLKYKYHMPGTLSGGQKQRVAIARALAMHPEVMLFDEPTSALDPTMVDEVENIIRGLVEEGMTSIIVTHEMRFAKSVASKVIFLAEKGIYEAGSAEEVFDEPKRPLTKQFLFRSRMYEYQFVSEEFDQYQMRDELGRFLDRYEHTTRQYYAIAVMADELLFPVVSAPENHELNVSVQLICDETDNMKHVIIVSFEGLEEEPESYLDELNMMLIIGAFSAIECEKQEKGWEVSLSM